MLTLEQYKEYGFSIEWINNSMVCYLNKQGWSIPYKFGTNYVNIK